MNISSVCQLQDVLGSSPSWSVGGEILEHFHGEIVKVHQCSCVLLLLVFFFSLPPVGCAELTFSFFLLSPSHTWSPSKPIYTPTCTALKDQLIHPFWDTSIGLCCFSQPASPVLPSLGSPVSVDLRPCESIPSCSSAHRLKPCFCSFNPVLWVLLPALEQGTETLDAEAANSLIQLLFKEVLVKHMNNHD